MTFTPCCDRTALELPLNERISYDPGEVSCGRLSAIDESVLTGGPFAADHQNSEQLLFEMAANVRSLCGPSLSMPAALNNVRIAVRELVGMRRPDEFWSAELMVLIATRASELASD